jgi:hypothetical protein
MDETAFWRVIDESRRESGGEPIAHSAALRARLAKLRPEEIVAFDRLWHELQAEAYRWDLWAAAYVINGGCSDDCFEYFRSYLIARGEEVFRRAVADPDSLAEIVDEADEGEWEELAYAAMAAYEGATGEELTAPVRPDPPQPAGAGWDEDDPASVVPRLAAKFDEG